ncbi:MAG: hypothetical protein FWD28_05965 [Treponema sp.]|nr:hypothetical protein [Treponema sp.]
MSSTNFTVGSCGMIMKSGCNTGYSVSGSNILKSGCFTKFSVNNGGKIMDGSSETGYVISGGSITQESNKGYSIGYMFS